MVPRNEVSWGWLQRGPGLCLEIASSLAACLLGEGDANVMCVAAMVIGNGFPVSQKRLMTLTRYFEVHADAKVRQPRTRLVLNLPAAIG